MPYNLPRKTPDPEPEVSPEEMLAIREDVKQKLIRDYHSHRLTARLYRKIGKGQLAELEEHTMRDLKRMIDELSADAPEPGEVRRLLEQEG